MHFFIWDMSLKRYHSILLLLFITFVGFGQAEILDKRLSDAAQSKIFISSNLSFSVFDVETKREVGGYRPLKVLTPASSFKLLTTFTALKVFGAQYRFKTLIGYTGSIREGGILDGDLVIKGSGDPTLGSDKVKGSMNLKALLNHIQKEVIAAGINCIKGDVVIDESIFDSYPVAPSWQWNDLGNYYASGAWGLNVNENQYVVYFKNRGIIGHRPSVHSVSPKVPKLNLSNEIVVDSSHTGDQAYIFGGPYNYDKRIVGSIPQGTGLFSIKGSLPDPPYFFGYQLKVQLEKANIQADGITKIYQKKRSKLIVVDTILSPPLSRIIKKANVESNNLYTESLLKLMGLEKIGQGSGQNGLAVIIRQLRKYGVKTKSQIFQDGSGLSARTQVSSNSIARFLASIADELGIETCTDYLPKGGYSGTVRGMFGGSSAKGNVWLKSGSMSAVQSYSGYIKAKSGRWLSFSLIANGFTEDHSVIRSKLESLIIQIYKEG